MEVCKFDQYHRYLSSVSLRLQMVYPNIWILRFTRQMDLELMISSIISLRMTNWNKWTKLFTDLLVLFIGFYLLIGFIYWIWWFYLLDLSISFSFSVHSIHSHSNLIQIFSETRKEHLYISFTIHISGTHGKNLSLSITSSLVLH